MTVHTAEFTAEAFSARIRRSRYVASFSSIITATVALAFVIGAARAIAHFAVAALLSAVVTRFLTVDGAAPAELARRSSRAVFRSSFVPLLVAPIWVAALDPTSGLSAAAWRSIAVSAAVCAGIASLVTYHWTWLVIRELDSAPADVGSVATSNPRERGVESAPIRIRNAIAATAVGLLLLLGDGVARAFEQDWSTLRLAAAGALFGAGGLLLAFLLAHWISRELALSGARGRGESAAIADHLRLEMVRGIDAFEAEIGRSEESIRALGGERDQQAVEQRHVAELARSFEPSLGPLLQNAVELRARIESGRQGLAALRAARDAIEACSAGMSVPVEATSQWLASLNQEARQRATAAAKLVGASRETAASLAELARSMHVIDASAESITELSRDVVTRAEAGRARLGETAAGMEAIRDATQAAESVIRGLGARTQEIGGILDVIDDVGDQTSLLALNAAIIAAQAGEHGRAFSVVADEIRDLADRVLVSTKEVGGLIRAVQAESEQAIGAIAAGSASVLQGIELSAEAGRALDEITTVARETGTQITAVVASVRTQTRALDQVEAVAGQVESAARALVETRAARDGDHEVAARAAFSLRSAVETIRASTGEQAGSLARIEDELAVAHEAALGIGSSLEACGRDFEELARVIEVGSTRAQSLGAGADVLAAVHRALRVQADALRTEWVRRAVPATRSGHAARTTGEHS